MRPVRGAYVEALTRDGDVIVPVVAIDSDTLTSLLSGDREPLAKYTGTRVIEHRITFGYALCVPTGRDGVERWVGVYETSERAERSAA